MIQWGQILTLGIPKLFEWFKGRQEHAKQAQAFKHEWEVVQARRSTTILRVISFLTIWGPIYHAYYLSMTTATLQTPDDVAQAVNATFSAFPAWWTGAAVMILLAVWGIREASDAGVVRSAVKAKEYKAEADKEREKNRTSALEESPKHRR